MNLELGTQRPLKYCLYFTNQWDSFFQLMQFSPSFFWKSARKYDMLERRSGLLPCMVVFQNRFLAQPPCYFALEPSCWYCKKASNQHRTQRWGQLGNFVPAPLPRPGFGKLSSCPHSLLKAVFYIFFIIFLISRYQNYLHRFYFSLPTALKTHTFPIFEHG